MQLNYHLYRSRIVACVSSKTAGRSRGDSLVVEYQEDWKRMLRVKIIMSPLSSASFHSRRHSRIAVLLERYLEASSRHEWESSPARSQSLLNVLIHAVVWKK